MATCEPCWNEASRRAQVRGGVAADWYQEVLAEHPDGHEPDVTTGPGNSDESAS